jgi:membrane fusion protein (multidrug efflux system)
MKNINMGKILVALFILIVIFRIGSNLSQGAKKVEARVIPVITSTPTIGTISETLALNGDIKGETEVQVRPKIGGRAEEIYVNEGDSVKKGDKLLSFIRGIKPDSDLYKDMVTFAPISGIIGIKYIKEGEQVTSSAGVLSPVFSIYAIDQVKIYADVPEKYYSQIHRGTAADISLDAYPDAIFKSTVSNVRPIIDPLSRTTQIEIVIPNYSHKIKPGMFSRINLYLNRKNNALIIPADAVLGDEEKYVFISQNGKAVKKAVKIGIEESDKTEILSGLTPSEEVITLGQRVVENGSMVEVVKK